MHPVLIDFGFVKIYSWGFMLAIAVIVAIFGLGWRLEREGYDKDLAFNIILLLIFSGLIGSRVGYVIVYRWPEFLADPLYLFRLTDGGLSGLMWYGGFIFAFITYIVYARMKALPMWKFADMTAPFFILGYAIVRIGCFLAGCCYGKETASVFGVVFSVVDEHLRYPTQLMSSGINFLFFLLLMYLYPRRRFNGQLFSITMMGYAVYRFLIEFLRFSEVHYGIFSPAQVISIFLFAFGAGLYLYLAHQDRNRYQTGHISFMRKPWERQ